MLLFVRYRPRARVVVPVVALLTLAAIGGAAVALRSGPDRLAAGLPSLSPSPSVTTEPSETPSPSASATAAPSASPLVAGPVPSASPTARVVKVTCKESAAAFDKGVPNDGTITGVVTDAAGHPLKGIRLAGGGECGMKDAVTGVNLTGADGRFAVPCVTRWKMSGQWWALPIGWKYDGTATGPYGFGFVGDSWGGVPCGSARNVVLRAPGTVHVQLVDSHDDPVARDVYFVMNAGFSEGDAGWTTAIGTDPATGRLTFSGLAPGPYYLYSSNGGTPGDKSTEVRGGFTVKAGETVTVKLLVPNAATPSPAASATPVT